MTAFLEMKNIGWLPYSLFLRLFVLCGILLVAMYHHDLYQGRAIKHVVSISDHRAGWPHIVFRLASQMSIDDYLTQTDEDVDISSAT